MAQTWPPTKWKRALLGVADSFGRPVARAVRAVSKSEPVRKPQSILVVELWQIGDVVLTTPFLGALRKCFPHARISFLGKPHAAELLAESGLVDEVIVAELPWTRQRRKYSLRSYHPKTLRKLITSLRAHRFDVAFDARMDIRSNILVSLSGARRRIGFRHGGGDWLLTDAVHIDPLANHKVEDWLALLPAVECTPPRKAACFLRTTEAENTAARATIAASVPRSGPVVAIHPGGSHAGKRWPLDAFERLASELVGRGHNVIAFADPHGYGAELGSVDGVASLSPTLRDLMAILQECALLVCNDSGPMHIAAALSVPTVAIFERGEPRWFGPVGDNHIVISGVRAGKDVSAAPVDEVPPRPVPVSRVLKAVLTQLGGDRLI